MSYFSQSGHETMGNRASIRRYLLYVTVDIWDIFEDQGDMLAFEQVLDLVLHGIWVDMLGFAGIETHCRILGLAHNAEFETIEDAHLRASCETKALKLGRHFAVNRSHIHSILEVNKLAERLEKEIVT